MSAQGMELVKYDSMCRAIAEAYAVDEVKDIRDKSIALEAYFKQAKNTEAERKACEIRLRAERKAGELLKKSEKAKGARGNPGGQGATVVRSQDDTAQTLAEMGISKSQSAKWQQLADISGGRAGLARLPEVPVSQKERAHRVSPLKSNHDRCRERSLLLSAVRVQRRDARESLHPTKAVLRTAVVPW